MTRADADSWDMASSVGATATMVAAARAIASREPDAIIDDPFAEPLVRAVGMDFFNRLVDGEIGLSNDDGGAATRLMTDVMAVRTRFFDDFFTGSDGIRQAVILASGLDARAYRLQWPAGTVVYEIDQPKVIDFKTATMDSIGAMPTAERARSPSIFVTTGRPHCGATDLTTPSQPRGSPKVCWSTCPRTRRTDCSTTSPRSAPGQPVGHRIPPRRGASIGQRAEAIRDRWAEHGFDMNLAELFYPGERNPVVEYLAGHGWLVNTRTRPEMFAAYGREFPDGDELAPMRDSLAVTATRQ